MYLLKTIGRLISSRRQGSWAWVVWGIGFLILVHAVAANSAEPEARNQAVMLDAMVVTAHRTDDEPLRTGDVNKEITPVMTTTIRREAFEGKTESLADVIEKEASVQVRQSGGLGSLSTVSLRGSSSEQVLVFLDGILLNDASGGGVDLSSIALADVAAIDIYRGAIPINFGSSSIGGAVNIRTLRAKEGLNASVSGGYGSFNTRKLNGFINHKPGRFDYLISADHLESDNDFRFRNDKATDWNREDDQRENRENAQVEQQNLLVKSGYDFTDALRVELVNQLFLKDQGIPDYKNDPLNEAFLDTRRNITTLQLIANDVSPALIDTRTRLTYTWKEEEYDDRGNHIGLIKQHETYETGRFDADLFVEWMGAGQNVVGVVNVLFENYEQEDHLDHAEPQESDRKMITLGLQDSIYLLDDSLIVTPSVQYNWIKDAIESTDSESERNENYMTAHLGIVYRPMDWLKFKSNLARYVRQPSFFELFGDRGLFLGNEELEEEKGVNFDIGATAQWADPTRWLDRFSLTVAYFFTDADDLITRTYDARGIGQSVNSTGADIWGTEFSVLAEFLDCFRVVVNITRQDSETENERASFDGKQLSGRFENAFHGRFEVWHAGVTIHVEYNRETGMYYDTANTREAPDKKEVSAGISWLVGSWLIQIEGKNLTDEMFEDFNGFPLPERSLYGSVKYTF